MRPSTWAIAWAGDSANSELRAPPAEHYCGILGCTVAQRQNMMGQAQVGLAAREPIGPMRAVWSGLDAAAIPHS